MTDISRPRQLTTCFNQIKKKIMVDLFQLYIKHEKRKKRYCVFLGRKENKIRCKLLKREKIEKIRREDIFLPIALNFSIIVADPGLYSALYSSPQASVWIVSLRCGRPLHVQYTVLSSASEERRMVLKLNLNYFSCGVRASGKEQYDRPWQEGL